MPIQDQIAHAAAVTKWKADQQMRILKAQSQMREIENQIRSQKSLLADTTLGLHAQARLLDNDLTAICQTIDDMHRQIQDQQQLQVAIKNESGPQKPTHSAAMPVIFSGLICPQCGQSLAGRFCPEHGVEGVNLTASPSNPVSTPGADLQPGAPSAQFMCPICKRQLNVKFCPEHGAEGIPLIP